MPLAAAAASAFALSAPAQALSGFAYGQSPMLAGEALVEPQVLTSAAIDPYEGCASRINLRTELKAQVTTETGYWLDSIAVVNNNDFPVSVGGILFLSAASPWSGGSIIIGPRSREVLPNSYLGARSHKYVSGAYDNGFFSEVELTSVHRQGDHPVHCTTTHRAVFFSSK